MINSTEQIEALMDSLPATSGPKMELFLIGGGSMMYMGTKRFTKDIFIPIYDDVLELEGQYLERWAKGVEERNGVS